MASSSLDFSNCFRKQFTNSIYNKLKNGDSINIVGKKGTGRLRLLQDIQSLAQQEGITALVIDMNTWKHHYAGFVDSIQDQLLIETSLIQEKKMLEHTSADPLPIVPVSTVLSKHLNKHQHIFLLINNYDALLNNANQQFPKSFFDDLNSIKNKKGISLCINTEKSHRQCWIYYKNDDGEKLNRRLSYLDLEIIKIPKPTLAEIREAINEKLDKSSLWQNEPQKEMFLERIQDHIAPFDFFEIIVNSFLMDYNELSAEIRIKQAYADYKNNYRRTEEPMITTVKAKSLVEWLVSQASKIFGKK